MTRDEFNSATFGAGDKVFYLKDGVTYPVASVDFVEGLFGYLLDENDPDHVSWARCESVNFIPFVPKAA